MSPLRVPSQQDLRYYNAYGPFPMPMSSAWDEYPTYARWAKRQNRFLPQQPQPQNQTRSTLDFGSEPPMNKYQKYLRSLTYNPYPSVNAFRSQVGEPLASAFFGENAKPPQTGVDKLIANLMRSPRQVSPATGPSLGLPEETPRSPMSGNIFYDFPQPPSVAPAGPMGTIRPEPPRPFQRMSGMGPFAAALAQGPGAGQNPLLAAMGAGPPPGPMQAPMAGPPQTSVAPASASPETGPGLTAEQMMAGVQGRPEVMHRLGLQRQAIQDRQAAARRLLTPGAPGRPMTPPAELFDRALASGTNRQSGYFRRDPEMELEAQKRMTQNFASAAAAKEQGADADWDRRAAASEQAMADWNATHTPSPVGPAYTRKGPSESYARKLAERQSKVHQFASMRALGRKMRQGQPTMFPGMGGGGAGGMNPVAMMMMMGRQMGFPPEVIAQMAEMGQRGELGRGELAQQGRQIDLAQTMGQNRLAQEMAIANQGNQLARDQLAQTGREFTWATGPESYQRQAGLAAIEGGQADFREVMPPLEGGQEPGRSEPLARVPYSQRQKIYDQIASEGWSNKIEAALPRYGYSIQEIRTLRGILSPESPRLPSNQPGVFGKWTEREVSGMPDWQMKLHPSYWPTAMSLPRVAGLPEAKRLELEKRGYTIDAAGNLVPIGR